MTVFKLVSVVLELKGIQQANEEFWSCYEILEKEDMGEILSYSESGTDQWHMKIKMTFLFFNILVVFPDWFIHFSAMLICFSLLL